MAFQSYWQQLQGGAPHLAKLVCKYLSKLGLGIVVDIPIVGIVKRHTFQGTTPKGNRQTLWAYMGFMLPATLRGWCELL